MDRYKKFSYVISFAVILFVVLSIIVFDMGIVEIVIWSIIILADHALFGFLSRNQNKIVCDKCEYKNKMHTTECVKCGNNIEDIICPTCKGVNQYTQKYCWECQTKL